MLHEFIDGHRDELVARTARRAHGRPSAVTGRPMIHGVPVFLTQLAATLRGEHTAQPRPVEPVADLSVSATRHGAELLAAGCNVSQVVHTYGDVCQAVTELADEQDAPITIGEFHTLNLCLDTGIAEAVTEHARLTAQRRSDDEVERFGHAAHELRDLLSGALLAFQALKAGADMDGNAGAVLDRSLASLESIVDTMLTEVRLGATPPRRETIRVASLLAQVRQVGALHADARRLRFAVLPVDSALTVVGDPELLRSALMNLVHNGFKNTPAGGAVTVSAHADGSRLILEVQDQCGGLGDRHHEMFKVFGHRSGHDQSGLGLGLSMVRQAVVAHGGEVHVRNLPGEGCVFAIDIPLAPGVLRQVASG